MNEAIAKEGMRGLVTNDQSGQIEPSKLPLSPSFKKSGFAWERRQFAYREIFR